MLHFQFSRLSRSSSSFIQFILTKKLAFYLCKKSGSQSISTSSLSFSIADRQRRHTEYSSPKEEQLKPLNEYVDIEKKFLPMDIEKQFKLIIQLSQNLEGEKVIRLLQV